MGNKGGKQASDEYPDSGTPGATRALGSKWTPYGATPGQKKGSEINIVIIHGCGINQCNGKYYQCGEKNGSAYYEHFDHGSIFCIMYARAAWRLCRKGRGPHHDEGRRWFYVSDDGYFHFPPSTGWQIDKRGVWPPPHKADVKRVPNPFAEIQDLILAAEERRWYTRRLRLRKNRTYNIINLVNTFRVTAAELPGLRDEVLDGFDEMEREQHRKMREKENRRAGPSLATTRRGSLKSGTTATGVTQRTTGQTAGFDRFAEKDARRLDQTGYGRMSTSPKARKQAQNRPARADSRAHLAAPLSDTDDGRPEGVTASDVISDDPDPKSPSTNKPTSPKARRKTKGKKKKKKGKKNRQPGGDVQELEPVVLTPKAEKRRRRRQKESRERESLELGTPRVPDIPFPDDEGSEEMEEMEGIGTQIGTLQRIATSRKLDQTLHVGGVVQISGLTGRAAAVFNGRLGVLHRWVEDKNAWGVMLDEDTECILMASNLERVVPAGWQEETCAETGVKHYKDT